MIATRNAQAALRSGDLRILYSDDALLAFGRDGDGERLLCLFNLGASAREWPDALARSGTVVLQTHPALAATIPAFAGLVLRQ